MIEIIPYTLNQVLVFATTYYIRPDGDDSNPGTGNSSEEAWQTLNFAINALVGGDTLYIADGNYETDPVELENGV